MALTKESIKTIHDDIKAALEAVAEKHGLSLQMKGLVYDETSFKMKEAFFAVKDAAGDVNPVLFMDLKKYGYQCGLTVENIGMGIKMPSGEFSLQGMRGRNKVVLKKATDGKNYWFKPEDVCKALGRAPLY